MIRLIGQWFSELCLSPFMLIGLIFVSFHSDGRRPVSYDVLNIIGNIGAMGSANCFNIFAVTKFDPGHLLMFKPLSLFSMVAASKLISRLLSGRVFYSIFHVFSPLIVKHY